MRKKSQEQSRLDEVANTNNPIPPWRKFGPYVSERSWASVREDYSEDGDAWNYFPFEEAHQRAYRWGDDGIAGWCDRYEILLFSPAFWNEKDPILKERLFGLSSPEGNHGEDVKERYHYLDSTPTHSYARYLYKYPHAEFPYERLKEENKHRGPTDPEFELIDTGIFDENAYFDIFIEYAKVSPEDTCIRIEAFNRGNKKAPLHIIPQLWFRNQWSWDNANREEPLIINDSSPDCPCLIADDSALPSPKNLAFDYHLGKRYLYGSKGGSPLFTNNDSAGASSYAKDAFHQKIVHGENSINPEERGSKACFHYSFEIAPHKSATVYLRLTDTPQKNPFNEIEHTFALRKKEADEFYDTVHPTGASAEEKMIQRQALSGMLWNRQFYFFDVSQWMESHENRRFARNVHWKHLNSMRIISMPDKWEFPWFAAWDLAFHSLSIALVDMPSAKHQLWLLLFDQFQHPNGGIPAYEWEFSDLNPPVQAWAAFKLYKMESELYGVKDAEFLKKCFLKLIMNFAYWVNKVDSSGCNVFEGGFLGLDNIAIVDRSVAAEDNMTIKQSDGTGWMAMFCLNLMRIALELAKTDHSYEAMATKFFQHFCYICHAMKKNEYKMWNTEDNFFYDLLVHPDGTSSQIKIRSFVGLIPLFAVDFITQEELEEFPEFKRDFLWFLHNRQHFTQECVFHLPKKQMYLLTFFSENRLEKALHYTEDPSEFRSKFGVRSLSKFHEANPYVYQHLEVRYEPGECVGRLKGGNSNWRGPVWFPLNYLLIESLKFYEKAYPHLGERASRLASELISLFTKDESGKRPVFGAQFSKADDPNFRDYLLFHEYFHAETGQGLGASHQTGWTGLVANLIDEFR